MKEYEFQPCTSALSTSASELENLSYEEEFGPYLSASQNKALGDEFMLKLSNEEPVVQNLRREPH